MGFYATEKTLLGVATYNAATNGPGLNFAEYGSGQLYVHVRSLSVGGRVYPVWAGSADATGPSTGRYVVLRAFATALKVTGLSVMTLPALVLGRWHRIQVTLGGTAAESKLSVVAIVKAQS